MTGMMYLGIVADVMLPTAHAWFGTDFILQDDNDPEHRCRLVTSWKEQEGVVSLPWPSQRPDLNPIEHLWDKVKKEIAKRAFPPTKALELKIAMKEGWERIDINYIQSLIASMPRRIAAVIKSRGGNTRY